MVRSQVLLTREGNQRWMEMKTLLLSYAFITIKNCNSDFVWAVCTSTRSSASENEMGNHK